jgi:hypothetical protein
MDVGVNYLCCVPRCCGYGTNTAFQHRHPGLKDSISWVPHARIHIAFRAPGKFARPISGIVEVIRSCLVKGHGSRPIDRIWFLAAMYCNCIEAGFPKYNRSDRFPSKGTRRE